MIPWEMGKKLVCDVLFVDALAPSRLNQCSLYNPGITVTEAEAVSNEYIFSTGGIGSTGFFRREQLNFHHASL